jgi:hypothetical protein
MGSSQLVLNSIPAGNHLVRIEHKGFQNVERSVTVTDGTTADLTLTMRPATTTASAGQKDVKKDKDGGGSTWLWIGGAAVLAGGGAAFILSQNKDKDTGDFGTGPDDTGDFPIPPGRP